MGKRGLFVIPKGIAVRYREVRVARAVVQGAVKQYLPVFLEPWVGCFLL